MDILSNNYDGYINHLYTKKYYSAIIKIIHYRNSSLSQLKNHLNSSSILHKKIISEKYNNNALFIISKYRTQNYTFFYFNNFYIRCDIFLFIVFITCFFCGIITLVIENERNISSI